VCVNVKAIYNLYMNYNMCMVDDGKEGIDLYANFVFLSPTPEQILLL